MFKAVFEQLGIAIDIKRSNGSKVTLTKRLDKASVQPSLESSDPNSSSDQDLSSIDDKSERILRLQQRKLPDDRRTYE